MSPTYFDRGFRIQSDVCVGYRQGVNLMFLDLGLMGIMKTSSIRNPKGLHRTALDRWMSSGVFAYSSGRNGCSAW